MLNEATRYMRLGEIVLNILSCYPLSYEKELEDPQNQKLNLKVSPQKPEVAQPLPCHNRDSFLFLMRLGFRFLFKQTITT